MLMFKNPLQPTCTSLPPAIKTIGFTLSVISSVQIYNQVSAAPMINDFLRW